MAVNLLAVGAMIIYAPSIADGISSVRSVFNPFNVYNLIMETALFSPALIALWWRARRKRIDPVH